MSDLFNLYVEAGSPNGHDQPQSAQRWAADEIARLRADHERLVEVLEWCRAQDQWRYMPYDGANDIEDLLAALEAEKGGGSCEYGNE